MGRRLFYANEALAFVLEIAALVALGWWGFTRDGGFALRALLGVGAPLAGAVIWGLFAAPRATFKIPAAGVLAVKAVFFLAAALAADAVWNPTTAAVFAVIVVANIAVATTGR
ncbi:uncharacterized protein DUF2568 [Actinocorallia herbida]|uniref:Uncharacterized protein DUF2568 n=1 Tax=Actinocorallia herbida TaxID=58109 RepID=A0A3N1D039_9ACTN|nr:YrdB family protein [Actinocorallia herbida]ROO86408.1 uncharacterized protein DUF2568 [Actinocorallia herbida]